MLLDVIPNAQIPYSQEAEEAALGACFCNPEALVLLASFLHPDDFFILRHRKIFDAMLRIDARGENFNYITVMSELRGTGELEEIGGPAYLTGLINNTPDSMAAELYGRLVERAAIRRRLLETADKIQRYALDGELTVDEIRNMSEAELLSVSNGTTANGFRTLHDLTSEHYDHVEDLMRNPNAMIGIPSGFRELDAKLRGWQRRRLYLVAGRPGLGKSSLLACAAIQAARFNQRVAFFSLEMGELEILDRLSGIEARIDTRKLNSGMLNDEEFTRYTAAIGRLSDLPLFIHDNADITPMGIRSKCRTLAHTVGLDAVFVDYVQLVEPGMTARFNNREQEVSYVSRSLKRLAMELNVPVIAAAQLSREPEKRQDKRPQLSELRESGGLEQDCDAALLMYSDNYYNENGASEDDPMWTVEVNIAKQRNGPTGHLQLGFFREFTQFVNLDKVHLNGALNGTGI